MVEPLDQGIGDSRGHFPVSWQVKETLLQILAFSFVLLLVGRFAWTLLGLVLGF